MSRRHESLDARQKQLLRRANRALLAISSGNHAVVRAVEERSLLADVCRIIVETAGYRRGNLGLYGWVIAGVVFTFWVSMTLVVPPADRLAALVGTGIILCPIGLVGLGLGRRATRRPSLAKRVQVVKVDTVEGWMDIRFGNQDYARLATELNQLEPSQT